MGNISNIMGNVYEKLMELMDRMPSFSQMESCDGHREQWTVGSYGYTKRVIVKMIDRSPRTNYGLIKRVELGEVVKGR